MAKSLPPLAWFRAFEAAARRLSFTAAAEEIGLTQSAVSQHIRSLETRLGVALFNRHPRGLTLTDDGRRLLPDVGAALETLAAATDAFHTGPTQNLLTVASSISVAQWIIAPNLSDFRAKYPNVRLRFLSTIWPDDFQTTRADVEIRFGSERQVGQSAVALSPNRLIALKSPALVGRLEDLPLIESVGTSDGWSAWCEKVGGHLQPATFVDSFGAALHFAVHGNGVALVSELLAKQVLETGQLIRAHKASIPGKEGYFLHVNDEAPMAKDFRDWFLDQL